MDTFFVQSTCDRCGGTLAGGRTMSMFNTECICRKCKAEEVQRPDYQDAASADRAEIRRGNYNFLGIGYKR